MKNKWERLAFFTFGAVFFLALFTVGRLSAADLVQALLPGDKLTVSCPTSLSRNTVSSREWNINCRAATPTRTATATRTAIATSSPVSTVPPTVPPSATNTPAPISTPTATPPPVATPTRTATPSGNVVNLSGIKNNYSVNAASNTTYQCAPGTILDGKGTTVYAFHGTSSNVTIKGCIIQNYNSPQQNGAINSDRGARWTVENNEVRYNNAAGILLADDHAIMRNNFVHHNGQIGVKIVGDFLKAGGSLVEGNEISFNNYQDRFDGGWEAGGSKFVLTTNLTVRSNSVHDNHGPGLWTDYENTGTLYEDNLVKHNCDSGIFHEISHNAIIRNNRIEDNGWCRAPWLWGGAIQIAVSDNVEVYGNQIAVAEYGNGIVVIEQDRLPFHTKNINVHDNLTIYRTNDNGWSGGDNIDSTVKFNNNRYFGSAVEGHWFWNDEKDWNGFRASGQEAAGTVSGAAPPFTPAPSIPSAIKPPPTGDAGLR